MDKNLRLLCRRIGQQGKRRNSVRRAYIIGEAEELGLKVIRQGFSKEGERYENIIIRIRNGNPSATLAVSAHYDTVAEGDGAIDNASGVTVLLSYLNELIRSPGDIDLTFLFFDGEEEGRLGSKAYVNWARLAYVGVYNFDTVGRGSTVVFGEQTQTWYGQTLRNDAGLNNRLRGVCEKAKIQYREVPFQLSSDHVSFMLRGIPATLVQTMSVRDADKWAAGRYDETRIMKLINGPDDTIDEVQAGSLLKARTVLEGIVNSYRT
jgi:putative aminopeptidase FrvX